MKVNEDNYRRALTRAVSDLWAGRANGFDFIDAADRAVETWFRQEWYAGAALCGVQPDELTIEEQDALASEINQQITFLIPFMNDILNGSEARGGPLMPFLQRVELWVNDLGRIRTHAQNMACADQKAEWVYGDTISHCPSCSFYEGKVYRRSVWEKYLGPAGLLPRTKGGALSCGGWRCLCSLENTNQPANRGRPPIWKADKVRGKVMKVKAA